MYNILFWDLFLLGMHRLHGQVMKQEAPKVWQKINLQIVSNMKVKQSSRGDSVYESTSTTQGPKVSPELAMTFTDQEGCSLKSFKSANGNTHHYTLSYSEVEWITNAKPC